MTAAKIGTLQILFCDASLQLLKALDGASVDFLGVPGNTWQAGVVLGSTFSIIRAVGAFCSSKDVSAIIDVCSDFDTSILFQSNRSQR
jgi:hypothetical protein